MPIRSRCSIIALSVVLLSACSDETPPADVVSMPRPVKTQVIEEPGNAVIREFAGRVTADKRATLSFQISGKLEELRAREGLQVKTGEVLAKLDDKDLEIAVRDRDASYRKAATDFKRAQDLVGNGHISRREYDALEASLASAKAALDQAQNNLTYATLMAPFDGSVVRRLVNDFEQVNAKQPILELHDLSVLEIKVDVPETIVQRIERRGPEADREITNGNVHATFESLPGRQFPLVFKEAAAQADADTQTFEVSFTMERPPQLSILPGMSATVIANMAAIVNAEPGTILIPAQAVVADETLTPYVWLVGEDERLEKRVVQVGELQNGQIQIVAGLSPGDRLVVAGMAYLSEGMEVMLMPLSEQAQPSQAVSGN
ncbi:MAG: efflux RND transporter periplasmic adaptor subunit [Gammaproteobacteria bacterium]|nr:efflux RND transporter periplasmic adaptor subunit [Gammaproteobacteria bacterium]MCP5136383.1 efflux RND transporter periplasmic adaptor subunit [Gammaproteobacteria bacterium]